MEPLVTLLTEIGRSSGIAQSVTAYAIVSALHIIGIALLLGAIAPVCATMIGVITALDGTALTVLRRFAAAGLALACLTGLVLISTKPADYLANPVVLVKLAIIGLGLVHAILFHLSARAQIPAGPTLAISGLTSLAIWLLAIALGRWIAFSM